MMQIPSTEGRNNDVFEGQKEHRQPQGFDGLSRKSRQGEDVVVPVINGGLLAQLSGWWQCKDQVDLSVHLLGTSEVLLEGKVKAHSWSWSSNEGEFTVE